MDQYCAQWQHFQTTIVYHLKSSSSTDIEIKFHLLSLILRILPRKEEKR